MEITKNSFPNTEKFNSFQLIFTIHTKEEAQALYAIFNHSRNVCLLEYRSDSMASISKIIRGSIGEDYYTPGGDKAVISHGITKEEFYNYK